MHPYIEVLHKEVAPAQGCTEPIAVAYGVSIAAEQLEGPAESIQLYLSGNIVKNALGVGIPGTGRTGIDIAALLGAVIRRSDKKLEILNGMTQQQLAQAEAKLQSREIGLQEAGTLAEAALQLNAIFEAADSAASLYLENIRAMADKQRSADPVAPDTGALEADAGEQAQRQLAEVAERCRAMEQETRQRSEAIKAKAQKEPEAYWAEVSRRIEQYLEEHEELTEWLLRRRESRMRGEQQ